MKKKHDLHRIILIKNITEKEVSVWKQHLSRIRPV